MVVYKITNLINNKIYIGLTTKPHLTRFKEHKQLSKRSNYAIHQAMRKYGVDNFKIDIIESCNSLEDLVIRESYWIKTLDSMNPKIGYNMINQEQNFKILSDDVKLKLSRSQIERISKLSDDEMKKIYMQTSIGKQGKLRDKKEIRYIGVYRTKHNRFCCEIAYLKKRYRRTFLSVEDAAIAYDKLALFLYGDKARLNFSENVDKYLQEDLILFVDWFLTDRIKRGKPAKFLYKYDDLILESKNNAKLNICKYNILNVHVPDLRFLYDGTINPNQIKVNE